MTARNLLKPNVHSLFTGPKAVEVAVSRMRRAAGNDAHLTSIAAGFIAADAAHKLRTSKSTFTARMSTLFVHAIAHPLQQEDVQTEVLNRSALADEALTDAVYGAQAAGLNEVEFLRNAQAAFRAAQGRLAKIS